MTTRLSFLVTGLLALLLASSPAWGQRVRYQLGWLVGGSTVPYVVAIDKGFYREVGLEVEILRGYGGAQTATNVDQAKVEFGMADMPAIIVGRSKGMKVKAVSMLQAISGSGFGALRETGIKGPKDFAGRSLGISPGDSAYPLLPIFFRINGVDAKQVKIVNLSPTLYVPSLLEKKVDIVPVFQGSNLPMLTIMAKKMGTELNWIAARDYGLDIYSMAIVVQDKFIQEKPDLVKRFVQASFKGVVNAIAHRAEGVETLIRYYPLLKKTEEEMKIAWDQIAALFEKVPGKGYGWMKEDKMKLTRDIVAEGYNIKETIPLEELYTNSFLGPAEK